MSNEGFEDDRFAQGQFRRKDNPSKLLPPRLQPMPSSNVPRINGKIVLQDELAKEKKSKTVTGKTDLRLDSKVGKVESSEDNALCISQHSESSGLKSDSLFTGKADKKIIRHGLSTSSANSEVTNRKHNKSETETGPKSETDQHPLTAGDELTESVDSSVNTLRESGAL